MLETSFIWLWLLFSPIILIVPILNIVTFIVPFIIIFWHLKDSWRIHFDKIKSTHLIFFFIKKVWYESSFYLSFEGELWRFYDSPEKTIKSLFGKLLKLGFDFWESLWRQIVVEKSLWDKMKQLKDPQFSLNMMRNSKSPEKIVEEVK